MSIHSPPTPVDPGLNTDALAPGTVLLGGQYVIESYLSSGGFGITYLARDSLDRKVVIKECFPEALCNRSQGKVRTRLGNQANEFQSLVDMFVREARSVAKLKHPNIVGVHQVFEDNATAYMALDLIDGDDLLDLLERAEAPFEPALVKSLLRTLLDAISVVHAQDMLHRDISPDNILIDTRGNPVLIDFGAAREEASKKSRAISALLVVKDGYSPQEFYISGGKQGPFSDLYSLGATFYHLITGDAPVNSQTRIAALAAHRDDPYEPLLGRFESYDRHFLSAIDTVLNVFPDDRLQTAEDWIAMIDAQERRKIRTMDAARTEEMQKIIADLVSTEAAIVPEPDETTPLEMDDERIALPDSPRFFLLDDNDQLTTTEAHDDLEARGIEALHTRAPGRGSGARMRLSYAAIALICAAIFSIYKSPDANLVAWMGNAATDLIDVGRDMIGV